MASVCARSTRCASMSSLRSFLKPSAAPAPRRAGTVLAGTAPPAAESSGASARRSAAGARFSSLSRCPSELGCCSGSLLPLHSAVAAARLTSRLSSSSRSCRALSQGTLCRTYPGL